MRAIAVLAVVIFHAFPAKLKGGFVGVDIFFVISGYLISTIIYENLNRGSFSFAEFYARRVKRIFPALLVVLAACFLFGWFALLADEFTQLSKHIMAGIGFISNFVFWNESGYFDSAAEAKPLLHLWSLGIEEQFYIFWPLAIWLAWRSRIGMLLVTAGVLVLSFGFNIHGVSHDTVAAYYSPQTRFWELAAGGVLAYLTVNGRISADRFSPLQANGLALAGFLMLGAGVLTITKASGFPGWWALLPVGGTVLLIMVGNRSWLNRHILSNRVAVWFGLISFPLYLWHWPILSFGRIIESQTPGRNFRIAAVLASILLAWLTYRFVERHIRSRKGYRAVAALMTAAVLLASASAYVYVRDGLPARSAVAGTDFSSAAQQQLVGPLWAYTRNDTCMQAYPFPGAEKLAWWFCMQSSAQKPTLAILGNSFANQLYPGFVHNDLLAHHVVLSVGTCDFGAAPDNRDQNPNNPCFGRHAEAQQRFIDGIVANERSIRFVVIDGLSREPDAAYIQRVQARISYLESLGIRVIVFTPHLRPEFHPKACYHTPMKSTARDCSFPLSVRAAQDASFQPLMDAVAASNPQVRFFDQNDIFCDAGTCSFIRDGMPLVRDEVHMSEFASDLVQGNFTLWAKQNVPDIFDPGLLETPRGGN
ncbi:MAG: acyltransferase [Alphaproteobacteria bacterium]|nr:MAG: acyltransferase [Alphaproteobacteria bacterium]